MECKLNRDQLFSRRKHLKKQSASLVHYHNEYELYYMLDGETTYFIEDRIYSVEKGNFVFIPRGVPHRTDSLDGRYNERLLLNFGEEMINEKTRPLLARLGENNLLHIPEQHLPELEQLFLKIESEYRQQAPGQEALLEVYIHELLILLCRYQSPPEDTVRKADQLIYDVSEYIRSNYGQDITLSSLSRLFWVNESHLSRKFKSVTGIGLNQYIAYVRISNAEKMLRETQLSVTEIAGKCGFNDSGYFAAVFKKINGGTPLSYRKQEK